MVHIPNVSRVGLDAEVHEGGFKLKQLADFESLALFFYYFVCVLLKQSENVQILVQSLDLVTLCVVGVALRKLG